MKCFVTLLSVTAVFLGSAKTFADEQPGIPDEIIKEMDWLVGTWKAEGEVGGKTQAGEFTCRWAQTRAQRPRGYGW